ncbi:hypothetical protein WOLCODRAFT_139348 [Wolfiporia cocos MD-104 SS10]|uniref:RBR-type E3 ubiquitin transferase n=1 Tax=Wolfiporia cocos (strain MD-104) TaxID=742152 RepID=A0A2H3K935_WOLCO|nr:hypothetical protein WOLCODRAFT_139348 [Wolfiporia cocos MD-104 SS10]
MSRTRTETRTRKPQTKAARADDRGTRAKTESSVATPRGGRSNDGSTNAPEQQIRATAIETEPLTKGCQASSSALTLEEMQESARSPIIFADIPSVESASKAPRKARPWYVCKKYLQGACPDGENCRRRHPKDKAAFVNLVDDPDAVKTPASERSSIAARGDVVQRESPQDTSASHSTAVPTTGDSTPCERLKSDEICMKYLRRRCIYGRRCHRKHAREQTSSRHDGQSPQAAVGNLPSTNSVASGSLANEEDNRSEDASASVVDSEAASMPLTHFDTNTDRSRRSDAQMGEICRLFQRGRCKFGGRCRWRHVLKQSEQPSTNSEARPDSVELEKTDSKSAQILAAADVEQTQSTSETQSSNETVQSQEQKKTKPRTRSLFSSALEGHGLLDRPQPQEQKKTEPRTRSLFSSALESAVGQAARDLQANGIEHEVRVSSSKRRSSKRPKEREKGKEKEKAIAGQEDNDDQTETTAHSGSKGKEKERSAKVDSRASSVESLDVGDHSFQTEYDPPPPYSPGPEAYRSQPSSLRSSPPLTTAAEAQTEYFVQTLTDDRPSRTTNEICRKFQQGQCLWGDLCHRAHIPGFGFDPPIRPESCVENDNAAQRGTQQDETLLLHQSWGNADGTQEQPVRTPAYVGSIIDDRPSRRTDLICRAFQKGSCWYGDSCHRAHIPGFGYEIRIDSNVEDLQNDVEGDRTGRSPTPQLASGLVDAEPRSPSADGSVQQLEQADTRYSDRVMDDRPSRRMNVICRSFQKGKCRWDDQCPRAHIPRFGMGVSIAPTSAVSDSASYPPAQPLDEASAIETGGQAVPSPHHEQVNIQEDPREACRDYGRGRCTRGEFCRFYHPPLNGSSSESTAALRQGHVAEATSRHANVASAIDEKRRERHLRERSLERSNNPTLQEQSQVLDQPNSSTSTRNNRTTARSSTDSPQPSREPDSPSPSLERANANVPLVPPGLGLEAKLLSSPAAPAAPPKKEPPAYMTFTVVDSTRATFGPGFEVQQLMTGFETQLVVLKNIRNGVTPANLTEAVKTFGEVVTVTCLENSHARSKKNATVARIKFATHEQARQAASALDGSRLFGSTISAELPTLNNAMLGKGVLADGDVLLEFPAASRTGYAGYSSQALADEAMTKAHESELRGSWVTATVHQGIPMIGQFNICFQGLPPNAQVADVEQYGPNDGVTFDSPNYSSTLGAIRHLRERLQEEGDLLSFNVLPPPYKRGLVRVWAHFDSPAVADAVCAKLHNRRQRFCGHVKMYAKHVRSLSYNLPPAVYDALAIDIRELRSYAWHSESGSSITVLDRRAFAGPGAPVKIKLASPDLQSLTRLKTLFEGVLKGERITLNGEIVWDDLFSRRAGILYLEELEKHHANVLIQRDLRTRMIRLFGPPYQRAMVRKAILARVAGLRAQKTHRISLDGRLIGLFMSSDLADLQQQLGPENVFLDLWEREIRVRGDANALRIAKLAVSQAGQRHAAERHRHAEVECPVCFDEVTAPIALTCGHTWCKACLSNFLLASIDNKVFPLTCLGNEATCSQAIPLHVAQEVLSTNDFNSVTRASFLAYVHSRPQEFRYCPTPDCPQIYRKGAKGTILQCPSCLVRICAYCNVEYHEGTSCQDREAESDKMFEKWKHGRDVKNCPSCKVTIEREAGCNHMTCTNCKVHICWACLETFPTSGEVYEHMNLMHGGIGL